MARKATTKPKRPLPRANCAPLWQQRLKELATFKQKHGHCDVPRRYSPNRPLGRWVSEARYRRKIGKLSDKIIAELDALGFRWSTEYGSAYRSTWDGTLDKLAAYKQQHGHFQVARREAPRLARWVCIVRRQHREGTIHPRLTEKLDAMGFAWQPPNRWDEMFAQLVEFQKKHGHCNVSRRCPENPRLANWVNNQRLRRRCGRLKQDRIDRLNEIGFVWSACDKWNANLADLAEFQRVHGHCRVSTLDKDHASLGCWVRDQRAKGRKGLLTAEQIEQLNRMGFEWNGRQRPERWEEMFAAFVEFKEAHGHCNVPKAWPENRSLANWVGWQRQQEKEGRLLPERRERLSAIGFFTKPGGRELTVD
jgi:hypothetical protein